MDSMEQMYTDYARFLYKYLLLKTHNEKIAEELVQETFYQAFKSLDRFDGSCKMSTWLCSIAKNQYRAYLRKYPATEEMDERFLASSQDSKEHKIELLKAMQKLPELQREVVYLRIYGNLSFSQIGDVLEKSENWARTTFYRAKLQLRKEMEK